MLKRKEPAAQPRNVGLPTAGSTIRFQKKIVTGNLCLDSSSGALVASSAFGPYSVPQP